MDRDAPDLNVPCIERMIDPDWHDSPDRLADCHARRFRERDIRKERDAITHSAWASQLFTLAHELGHLQLSGPSYTVDNGDSIIASARGDIDDLLAAMTRGEALARSPECIDLYERAAQTAESDSRDQGAIEEWARKLAGDLSKFSD